MEKPFLGVGNTVVGNGGGRGICPEEAEYGCAVHCNATNSRPMWGGIALAGDTDLKNVVGTGRVGLGGGMGGVSGSSGGGTRIGDRKGGRGVLGN